MMPLNCILLVDDDPPTNFLHHRLLEKMNLAARIIVARNGEEALDYLRNCELEGGAGYPYPDLIFLDINMPRMDGWEFLEHFRLQNLAAQYPMTIVMLTNSPNPDDRIRAGRMPEVKGFYSKPLSRDMLNGIIDNGLSERPG